MGNRDQDISRRRFLQALLAGTALPAISLADTSDTIKLVQPPPRGLHRIVTANILLTLPEQKGTPYDWDAGRREVCLNVLKAQQGHIYCLQEVGDVQNHQLVEAFPDFGAYGFVGPVSDKHKKRFKAIRNLILYSRERYRLVAANSYTLSETPIIDGSHFPGVPLGRHVNWVRLEDRATGRQFRVLNTHWSLTAETRLKEAQIIAAEAAQYLPDFPQVLCGDLNSPAGSEEHKPLDAAGWKDMYATATKKQEQVSGRRIDHILAHGLVKAVAARWFRETVNGVPPSDHPFVWADVEI